MIAPLLAARELLLLVDDACLAGPPTEQQARERSAELLAALDRLAVSLHGTPSASGVGGGPQGRGRACAVPERGALGRAFPELGLYRCLDLDLGGDPPAVGDALDDLLDLASELERVRRTEDLEGPQAALQLLELTRFHWGPHLRGLQGYLEELRSG